MLTLLLAAVIPNISTNPAPLPPIQYQKNLMEFPVLTTDIPNAGKYCPTAKEGWETRACTNIGLLGNARRIILPNPCNYPWDFYARIFCHEIGHVYGWPGDHPDKIEYKKETK